MGIIWTWFSDPFMPSSPVCFFREVKWSDQLFSLNAVFLKLKVRKQLNAFHRLIHFSVRQAKRLLDGFPIPDSSVSSPPDPVCPLHFSAGEWSWFPSRSRCGLPSDGLRGARFCHVTENLFPVTQQQQLLLQTWQQTGNIQYTVPPMKTSCHWWMYSSLFTLHWKSLCLVWLEFTVFEETSTFYFIR